MKFLAAEPRKRFSAQQALANHWITGKTAKIDSLSMENMRVLVNKKQTQVLFFNTRNSLKLEILISI